MKSDARGRIYQTKVSTTPSFRREAKFALQSDTKVQWTTRTGASILSHAVTSRRGTDSSRAFAIRVCRCPRVLIKSGLPWRGGAVPSVGLLVGAIGGSFCRLRPCNVENQTTRDDDRHHRNSRRSHVNLFPASNIRDEPVRQLGSVSTQRARHHTGRIESIGRSYRRRLIVLQSYTPPSLALLSLRLL
jgi:hypothetical protein